MSARDLVWTATLAAALGACGDADTPADDTAEAIVAAEHAAVPREPYPSARADDGGTSADLTPEDWVRFVAREPSETVDGDAERLELLRRYGALAPEARAHFDAELLRQLPPDDVRISGSLHGRAYPAAWLAPDEPGAPASPPDDHP